MSWREWNSGRDEAVRDHGKTKRKGNGKISVAKRRRSSGE